MKKILVLCLSVIGSLIVSAEVYNYLTIKQNGKTLSIPIENIESVTFTEENLTTPEDPTEDDPTEDDPTEDDPTEEDPTEEDPTEDDPTTDYELRVLTFEDPDYKGSGNYLGFRDWTSLVDSPQYGGPLLYGDYSGTLYTWYDENHTELCASIDPEGIGNVYWNGGEAISNYTNSDYAVADIDYLQQLSVPSGGNNGSLNFCVHNGYHDGIFYDTPRGGLWFHDGEARVIDHIYVCLTSYALSIGLRGNEFCDAATTSDWVKFVAIGTDAAGNTKETEITMCENGKFMTDWQKWDLSGLGEIVRLDFNIKSSMTGEYGLNFPGYIAYDDVAVRFKK